MRVVFMGTPDFAVPSLQAMVAAGHEVAAVITQPDRPRGRGKKFLPPPVKETALKAGLPVWQPARMQDEGLLHGLRQLDPELIVVVAFGRILPREILDLPGQGCVNLHASLLPRYRGAAPIHRAVMNGETETGVTTMWMAPRLDAGDIILQEKLPISPAATTGEIHDRLAEMGAGLLVHTLELIATGRAPRRPQDETLVTYAPPLRPEEEEIDWQQPAEVIYNQIRGLNPWPGAYTRRSGERLKIYGAQVAEPTAAGRPGEVVQLTKDGFVVQTGRGQVLITNVQPAGKRAMAAGAYLQGYPLAPGEMLGCG
ncbi:methionyl-tRNA formyltransferase [Moorella sp. Hama-1]|uniref:methionyl-tRNA formyltransferase n=1 Tax=Moorella sp. Hama-1 TaxID=2138101 RepID=UPI000D657700|nr:methionyl-tRNA formyltransferase [Moorella sp. Hama-1]MDN5362618.1 methionyl-tRNA formyltransferase [Moorella sp. (in: firmicutes)]BCV20962.1 methionyl-tRNA formyltransferase [Moorella sp. Hama-1]